MVAITAPCDIVEPWAAVVIGVIAGILFSCFSKILALNKIDDPLDAASVHFINGIWGCISCAIFDGTNGFIVGSPLARNYLKVQVIGVVCILVWSAVIAGVFFTLCRVFEVDRYHPVIEMLGSNKFKMGEISSKFVKKVRAFGTDLKARRESKLIFLQDISDDKDGHSSRSSLNQSDRKV